MNMIRRFRQLNIIQRKIRQQLVRLAERYLESTYGFRCARCHSPTPILHIGKFCDRCLISACQRVLNPSDIY